MQIVENYIECCAVCGNTILGKYPKMTICNDCHNLNESIKNKKTTVYISQHPQKYYETLSEQEYGTKDKWKYIFVKTELSKNPLFSHDKYLISCEKQKERDKRVTYRKEHPEECKPYIVLQPKCPTCGSTNIKKISTVSRVTHGYAFGLFSKTARSQFECKNCGYKW